jgi:hypothetical protein
MHEILFGILTCCINDFSILLARPLKEERF